MQCCTITDSCHFKKCHTINDVNQDNICLEKQMNELLYCPQPSPQRFQMFAPSETLRNVFVISGKIQKQSLCTLEALLQPRGWQRDEVLISQFSAST